MIMISIVICLSLEMFASHLSGYRGYQWADHYAGWIKKIFRGSAAWESPWGVLSVLLLPLLLMGLLQTGLAETWLGLFELILSVLTLLYCLRYQPLGDDVESLSRALKQDNNQEAERLEEKILGKQVAAGQCRVQQVCNGLLIDVNERVFAVIVWFALLGPMGALLYRLSWYYSEQSRYATGDFKAAMHRLYALLNWIPARLLVIAYAVVGSFEDAMHGWRDVYKNPPEDMEALNRAILAGAGCNALHLERYNHPEPDANYNRLDIDAIDAAHSLVLRTILAWGIVIAIMTLAGWAS